MRNSELMRRRANVSTLDLGRIKSDLEAIGEILQEGKKNVHSFLSVCIILRYPPSPPLLQDDLLMSSVLYE